MSVSKNVVLLDNEYLYQNYGDRLPVEFVRGDGSLLFDAENNRYIDFLSGISVTNLGYNNPVINKALHEQIDTIIHSSNWFFNGKQAMAAKHISDASFKGRTLFVNSGTEANEAAIKLARRYGQSIDTECYKIITFSKSFHGRTFGSMSATGNEKIRTGFGPVVPGFLHLPFNDIEAFKKAISEHQVCAVMSELIQGEGGIQIADKNFIEEVAAICQQNKILFIADEVQTAIGRTGRLFAYEHYNFTPDILTLAKGLANGIPTGAIHTAEELMQFLPAGAHGTTFGGNHLASAAICAVFELITESDFLNNVDRLSKIAFEKLNQLQAELALIKEVRGMGLHIGIELTEEGMKFVKEALKQGLVINCTVGNVLRIMPPLTIDETTLVEGLTIFEKILKQG